MRKRILATIVAVATLAVLALFVPAAASVRDHIERGELLSLQREASIVARRVPPAGAIDLAELRLDLRAEIAEEWGRLLRASRSDIVLNRPRAVNEPDDRIERREVLGPAAEATFQNVSLRSRGL